MPPSGCPGRTAGQLASLPLFVAGFVALFLLSGLGNGSTYTMIPGIFRLRAMDAVAAGEDSALAGARALRLSGAVIGPAGAIGAFGGVLVDLAFRQSNLTTGNGDAAHLAFIGCYVVCLITTWAVHLRRGARAAGG